MSRRPRPVVAVAASRGSTARLRPLARQLATRVQLCSLDRLAGPPDAVLVASVAALAAVSSAMPVAVWVDGVDESALVRSAGHDVRVLLGTDPAVVAAGAVAVPADAIDVRAHPVMPPLIRARRREQLGLPADFVVTVGTDADVAVLAVCAAAVVTGPAVVTGLALGTPMVCRPADVERLGLRAHEEVEVDPTASGRIAEDDEWAARLSVAARRTAEQRFDIGRIADTVLDRLGLGRLDGGPQERMERRLAELDTPVTATIRTRALAATDLTFPHDRS